MINETMIAIISMITMVHIFSLFVIAVEWMFVWFVLLLVLLSFLLLLVEHSTEPFRLIVSIVDECAWFGENSFHRLALR